MFADVRFIALIAIGAVGALAVVFSLPALTVSPSSGVIGEDQAATAKEESVYCARSLNDVDCRCFGQVAGYVRSEKTAPVAGTQRFDRAELARGQAKHKC